MTDRPAVLGLVAARSNSGKTTLLEALIPRLSDRGVRVSVIKHVHHRIDLDSPGKDSYRFRQAGAAQVMVASEQRWALLTESADLVEAPESLVEQLDAERCDLVLVEGLRSAAWPRIEVSLAEDPAEMLHPHDPGIIALVSRQAPTGATIPWFDIDRPDRVAAFVLEWLERRG